MDAIILIKKNIFKAQNIDKIWKKSGLNKKLSVQSLDLS